MKPFVTFKDALPVSNLLELITKFARMTEEPSYYFLRWTHQVSQDWKEQPKEEYFPMLEGQMFNHDYELRWKYRRKNQYDILLLSQDSYEVLLSIIAKECLDFAIVGEEWQTQDQDAYLHSPTEARFPKGFPAQELDIAQRYFIDKKTSTVHFVALTIKK